MPGACYAAGAVALASLLGLAAVQLAGRRWGDNGTFSAVWTDDSRSRADGANVPRMVPELPIIAILPTICSLPKQNAQYAAGFAEETAAGQAKMRCVLRWVRAAFLAAAAKLQRRSLAASGPWAGPSTAVNSPLQRSAAGGKLAGG